MGGWTYMLQCSDQSLYVGSTSHVDVSVRVMEHNDGKYIGFTIYRRPVVLVWSKWFDDIRDAHRTERRLKGWSRAKKQALIAEEIDQLKNLSKRRAGRAKTQSRPSKRELAVESLSIGIAPEIARRLPQIGGAGLHRHPEARAKRATKDD